MQVQTLKLELLSMPWVPDTSLADVFHKVPDLLTYSLNAWISRTAGIRAMRLVSKDLASLVPTAVRSCSVQIGEGAVPNPLQVTGLLNHALVKHLEVTVLVRTGEHEIVAHCCVARVGEVPSKVWGRGQKVDADKNPVDPRPHFQRVTTI